MMLDLALVVLLAAALGSALLAKMLGLPITALEILLGILLGALLLFRLPAQAQSLVVLGSLLIVFLAGLETSWDFLRQNAGPALRIGIPGFVVPFAGLLLVFLWVLKMPMLVAVIGATALADTSVSIVYTTLHQYGVAELPLGRLVLASTLVVNLVEDATITGTSFFNGTAVLLSLALLAALGAAAVGLPRLIRRVEEHAPGAFTNASTRSVLLSLAILATLSAMVSVPGILFVFLLGLLCSRYVSKTLLADLQKFAFAIFVPLYFLAVGLAVNGGFVLANLPLLLGLVGVATVLKIAGLAPGVYRSVGSGLGAPVCVLMNARLTSATVILLLTLS
ncbi:MAG: cation:proton antiporter, partial [Thermoplasmata archaeon]|nr:cation:proton antiporter [Thermoplasmata archaeon]